MLPHGRLQRWLQTRLGRVLAAMQPARARELEAGRPPHGLNDRMVLAGLVRRHFVHGTLERLAAQHVQYWQSDDAVRFHAETEGRFEAAFLVAHECIIDMLRDAMAPGDIHTLCELGCGSGRVLAYVGERMPALRSLVGIDLSERQCELNARRYTDPRLRFVGADAVAWIGANAGPGWAFLSYGMLEYLPQATLAGLFATMAARKPVCVAVVEPMDSDYDLARETASRAYGCELSYTHNYPRLLEAAGLHIVQQRECVNRKLRWMMVVARA